MGHACEWRYAHGAGAFVVAVVLLTLAWPVLAESVFPLHVQRQVPLAAKGDASGLAFTPDGSVVYASVGRTLEAIDTRSGSLLSSLILKGTLAGVVASVDGKKIFAATRDPAQWLVLGDKPLKVLQRAPLELHEPDHLYYDAVTRSMYLVDASSRDVARISIDDGKVLGSIRLRGVVGQIVGDPRGHLYVAIEGSQSVDVVDTASMQLMGTFATPRCTLSGALSLDPVGRRLFVWCDSGETDVLDTDLGFVFKRILLSNSGATLSSFAFHAGGCAGWKGGAFAIAGRHVRAVKMVSNVSYVEGGHTALPGIAHALAFSPDARQLWIAVGGQDHASAQPLPAEGAGDTRLLVLGTTCEGEP